MKERIESPSSFCEEQLKDQKTPFDALWSSQTHVHNNVHLTTLRTHLLRLLRLIATLERERIWSAVYFNLDSVASLEAIGLYTDVHSDTSMCNSAAERDEAFSRVNRHFVAGQLVFQGVWNSFEIAGESLLSPSARNTTQAVRHKLAHFGHRPIFGLKESLYDAHHYALSYIDFQHEAYREALRSRNHLCIAAEQLRQFRNGLLHGKIQPIEPQAWGAGIVDRTHEIQTNLFHAQIRLALFLLQAVVAHAAGTEEMIWPNDGLLIEDLIFGVQKDYSKMEDEDCIDNLASDEDQITSRTYLFPDQAIVSQV